MTDKKKGPTLPTISVNDLREYAPQLDLTTKQLNLLLKPTPAEYVHKRRAKGGGFWDYVSVGYVTKVLNLAFGFDWDFIIHDQQYDLEVGQAWVKGELCIRAGASTVRKMQFGRVDIKFKKDGSGPLDLGNDLKAAASDALKKCASMVGVAQDIYSREDYRPVRVVESQDPKRDSDRFEKYVENCSNVDELDMLVDDYEAAGHELTEYQHALVMNVRKKLIENE